MATRSLLHESVSTSLERKGNVWEATIITPGQGSSGKYAEDMLSGHVAAAFPKGTKHFFKHPTEENEQRDPRDQWGVTIEDSRYEPGVGGRSRIKILEHWRPVVESLAEEGQADLSVWVMGESDDDGNVIALYPDRQNTVDMVAFPGRPGSALTEKMFESARAASGEKPPAASVEESNRKAKNMEAWEKAVADLSTKFDASIAESKVALKAAEDAKIKAEADAKAALDSVDDKVKEALESYKQKAEAIEAAELLPSLKESLLKRASAGEDITEPLAEAVKVVTEAKTLAESAGGFIRTGDGTGADMSIGAWN